MFGAVDMADQRVEGRTALCGEDGGDGLGVAGIPAKPVDGFGWKGDKSAGGKRRRGGFDRRHRHIKPLCRTFLTFPGHRRLSPPFHLRGGCSAACRSVPLNSGPLNSGHVPAVLMAWPALAPVA